MSPPRPAFVAGGFDDFRLPCVRLLEEAARIGPVHVLLWSDEVVAAETGRPPRFRVAERKYLVESIRYVAQVTVCTTWVDGEPPPCVADVPEATWVVAESSVGEADPLRCKAAKWDRRVVPTATLALAAQPPLDESTERGPQKRVLVTGCYDWFHSGHVRFFEEAAALGDLYVVLGHDANIELLKGKGHPLVPQYERWYMVQAVRQVRRAMIATGHGWLDAEPEIERIRPHFYVVNEDGDRPEKRAYCQTHGIEYRVLRRVPKAGLPPRQSTVLRGF
jgi:cytidyltransferase-like protein